MLSPQENFGPRYPKWADKPKADQPKTQALACINSVISALPAVIEPQPTKPTATRLQIISSSELRDCDPVPKYPSTVRHKHS